MIKNNKIFASLKDKEFFSSVKVDVNGYEIVWNDDIDISCDELFNGSKV